MTEPITSAETAPASGRRGKMPGLRRALIGVAVSELLAGLWRLPVLFGRASILFADPFDPEPGLGDVFVKVYVASHPLLALVALAFAAKGRARHAIVALGTAEVMRWLNLMPGVVQYGLPFDDRLDVRWTATQIFIFPLMAVCGLTLAARNERPGLATLLVGMPTLYRLFGLTGFGFIALMNGR